MFMNPCDEILEIVKKWTPKETYNHETKYSDDLAEFIRKKGKPKEHFVKREGKKSRVDIEINGHIGIELKRVLKKKQDIDRLIGQISEFEQIYECIIVVLCGEVKEEKAEELEYRLKPINDRHVFVVLDVDNPKVTVVRKDETVIKGKEKKKPS